MSKRVTVATCRNSAEALVTRGLLANAGIEATLVDERGVAALLDTPGPIQVQAPVKQVQAALQALREGTGPRRP